MLLTRCLDFYVCYVCLHRLIRHASISVQFYSLFSCALYCRCSLPLNKAATRPSSEPLDSSPLHLPTLFLYHPIRQLPYSRQSSKWTTYARFQPEIYMPRQIGPADRGLTLLQSAQTSCTDRPTSYPFYRRAKANRA